MVWPLGLNWQEVDLDSTPFWVQLHGHPMYRSNEDTAQAIGGLIGEASENEGERKLEDLVRTLPSCPYIFDILKPLSTGYSLNRWDLDPVRTQFKFKRIASFCNACGLLGQTGFACPSLGDGTVEFGHGPWMRWKAQK